MLPICKSWVWKSWWNRERAPKPVIGIVVPRTAQSAYATTAFTIGRADLVHGVDEVAELEQILAKLDARIPTQQATASPPPPPVP